MLGEGATFGVLDARVAQAKLKCREAYHPRAKSIRVFKAKLLCIVATHPNKWLTLGCKSDRAFQYNYLPFKAVSAGLKQASFSIRSRAKSVITVLLIVLASRAHAQWRVETINSEGNGKTVYLNSLDQSADAIIQFGCSMDIEKVLTLALTMFTQNINEEISRLELMVDGEKKSAITVRSNPRQANFHTIGARLGFATDEYNRVVGEVLSSKDRIVARIGTKEYIFPTLELGPAAEQLKSQCMLPQARQAVPTASSNTSTTAEPKAQLAPAVTSQSAAPDKTETSSVISQPAAPDKTLTTSRPQQPSAPTNEPTLPTRHSAGNIDIQIKKARQQIQLGNIAVARALLEQFEDAEAKFVLAETFDPQSLRRWGVVGLKPDMTRANALYHEAARLGSAAAAARLQRGMADGTTRP
jgi:hypothetical protein